MSGVINVWCGECLVWSMSGVINVLFYTRCDQCLVWSMSGVINVRCVQCLVWWMSGVFNVLFYTQCDQCLVWSMSGVINVLLYTQCDQCLVWSMSGVINVWCDQCLVWSMSYFTHGVINVWCDQCLVWSMSVWSMSYNRDLTSGCSTDQEGFSKTKCIPPECRQELLVATFWKAFHLLIQPETGRRCFLPSVLPQVHFQTGRTQHLLTLSSVFFISKTCCRKSFPFLLGGILPKAKLETNW